MGTRFFGPPSYIRNRHLNESFELVYYGGFTYEDVNMMPVPYRQIFLKKISQAMKGAAGEQEDDHDGPKPLKTSRAMHHNPPDVRAAQGRSRPIVPARLTRQP